MDWKVEKLHTKTINAVPQVIVKVDWRLEKIDANEKYCKLNTKTTELEYNPDSPFIAYADLTEEQIITWVKNALGTDEVSFWENFISEQYERFINETLVENPQARGTWVHTNYAPEVEEETLPF